MALAETVKKDVELCFDASHSFFPTICTSGRMLQSILPSLKSAFFNDLKSRVIL